MRAHAFLCFFACSVAAPLAFEGWWHANRGRRVESVDTARGLGLASERAATLLSLLRNGSYADVVALAHALPPEARLWLEQHTGRSLDALPDTLYSGRADVAVAMGQVHVGENTSRMHMEARLYLEGGRSLVLRSFGRRASLVRTSKSKLFANCHSRSELYFSSTVRPR